MDIEGLAKNNQNNNMEEEDEIIMQDEEVAKLMQSLPIEPKNKHSLFKYVKYQGFWCPESCFKNVLTFQNHFKARDSDLIIASFPKTGNTWLKALLFAIVNRGIPSQNLLLQKHPHELVCYLEGDVYGKAFDYPQPRHLVQLPSPRLFSTHLPYHSLPESIQNSKCRILYLTRNPLDTFVSHFYFGASVRKKMLEDGEDDQILTMEEYFEKHFYEGKTIFGPFLDHVKEYWEKNLEKSNKIIFLMYEDLKNEQMVQIKRVAEFIGFPFSSQEESEGVIQKIINLCSIDHLRELDANKSGVINKVFDKKSYFRKGDVGDWTNHFTPSTVDRLMKFMEDETSGTGLSFKFNSY